MSAKPTSASMNSLNINFMKRRLMIPGVPPLNGYVGKSLPVNGSLPCTPELELDSETDISQGHTGNAALDNNTRELIGSFLRDFTGLSRQRWRQSKPVSTMIRVVENDLSKHRYTYNGMIKKLAMDNKSDDMGFVSTVAKSLFSDRTTNWGQIVSLVAFGAVVCQDLKERNREHCVELVSQKISTYLLTNQWDWLAKNNSWDGFVEFFKEADPEATVRKTLMAFIGAAGIGASLAFLIR
ncbi:hypothetical protein ATANTOWER_016628 [Ataeniobius toweri]|uniref:Bcl-2 Bcl-2 homology region 1-3 domain-containing protein n=1 Tax=Ataeniobius toweri TaxID=208326 RepID=A0ABU7BT61_9TELE|nr:hypothetical protein [Ataeniobius toweri]